MAEQIEDKKTGKLTYWQSRLGRFTVFLILVVLIWNTVQIWMMSGVVSSVNKYNLGAVDEMGKVVGDVKEFAADLTEIRRFLLLPEKQYGISGEVEKIDVSGAEDNTDNALALFNFLDSVKQEQLVAQNRAAALPFWEAFFNRPDFSAKLAEATLMVGERGDLQVKFLDNLAKLSDETANENFGLPLFNLVFSPQENLYRLQSVLGDETFAEYVAEDFPDQIFNYLKNNADKARTRKVEDAQKAQQLADEAAKMTVEQAESQKKELQDLVADRAFLDTIDGMGLKLAENSRQELNKEVFDILDADGRVRFSLALELSSGQIKLIKDNQEIDLKNFLDIDGSKKKP